MRDLSVTPAAALRPYDAVVPVFALILLALVVLLQNNQSLFLVFNKFAAQAPDGLWSHWTVLGDALLLLVLGLPWVGRRPDLVWTLLLCGLVVTLMVHTLKPWVGTPRPPAVLDPALFHVVGKALRSGSFPSGHTAAAFAFAGVVALHVRRAWVTALLLMMATGVGLSRIAVGVHWPADVLMGAAIGWTGACLAVLLSQRWRWGIGRLGQRWLALLLVGAALVLLWGHSLGYPQAALMQQLLAALALAAAAPGMIRLFSDREVGAVSK